MIPTSKDGAGTGVINSFLKYQRGGPRGCLAPGGMIFSEFKTKLVNCDDDLGERVRDRSEAILSCIEMQSKVMWMEVQVQNTL